ncbi:hypothetical protein LB505_001554 [Fusarium chuoi]|nr:hypothetical protein LB505_001554 [Fusarium chuoi]
MAPAKLNVLALAPQLSQCGIVSGPSAVFSAPTTPSSPSPRTSSSKNHGKQHAHSSSSQAVAISATARH